MIFLRKLIILWCLFYLILQPLLLLPAVEAKNNMVASRLARFNSPKRGASPNNSSVGSNTSILSNLFPNTKPMQVGNQPTEMAVFGPKVFRYDGKNGQPSVFTEQIVLPSWAIAPFTLVALSGKDIGRGSIKLNGQTVVRNLEVRKIGNVSKNINPNGQNTLTVRLDNGEVQITVLASIAAPTLARIVPNSANQQTTVPVEIFGTNFFNRITAISFGSGISVGTSDVGEAAFLDVKSPTEASTEVTVEAKAALGPRDVFIANGKQISNLPTEFNVTTSPSPGQSTVLVGTLAGTGSAGLANGSGQDAKFNKPMGIVADQRGGLYVADTGNNVIRFIDSTGKVTLYAGNGIAGFNDGFGPMATFNAPMGITIDNQGNLYVADTGNNAIRKIDPIGNVTTIAGGTKGFNDGASRSASFNMPVGLAVDKFSNIVVADAGNHAIRFIDTIVGMVTTVAGDGRSGFGDGVGRGALFNAPTGVAVNQNGDIFVTDTGNHRIRQIDSKNQVTSLAGEGEFGFHDNELAQSRFAEPIGIVVDKKGRIVVGERFNSLVRVIDGTKVKTLAGIGLRGKTDGSGDVASFNQPMGVAIDKRGIIYLADTTNHAIRRIQRGINGPIINEISPTRGRPGRTVTITGQRLLETTEVRFGNLVTDFTVVDDTKIEAICPQDAITAEVSLFTPAGTATSRDKFIVDRQDFALFNDTQAGPIVAGQQTSLQIRTSSIDGFSGKISLSVEGTSSLIQTNFGQSDVIVGSSTLLFITASNAIVPGAFTFNIVGKATIEGSEVVRRLPVTLSVINPGNVNPDFDIRVVPNKASIVIGKNTSFTINTISSGGMTDEINLSVSGIPNGTQATLSSTKVIAGQSVQLFVTTANTFNNQNYDLTITGIANINDQEVRRSTSLTVNLVNTPPDVDFTLLATPDNNLLFPGGKTSYSIEIKPIGLFSSDVNLEVKNLPDGVTANFEPTTASPTKSSALRVSASTNVKAGRYNVDLIASTFIEGAVFTHTTNLLLIVAGSDSTTTLRGIVMTADREAIPLAKVTVNPVLNPSVQVITDEQGRFTLTGLPAVTHQIINIDGHTADTATENYPVIPLGVDLVPNQVNDLDYIVYLPRIDVANNVRIKQNADHDQIITTPRIPNFKLVIPAHTTIVNLDGSPVPQISITPLLGDRMPMPMPDGIDLAQVPQLYTIQPGGAIASKPVQIFYPNMAQAPPGTRFAFYGEDHDLGTFRIFGAGKVSQDGLQLIPDPDPANPGLLFGLSRFSWHFPGPPCPTGQSSSFGLPFITRITPFLPPTLEQGESAQLRVIASLSNGRELDVTGFCTFASQDPAIATITSNGVVIANNNITAANICPSTNIIADLQTAPPGVQCNDNTRLRPLANTVSRTISINTALRLVLSTRNDSFLRFNGKEAVVFNGTALNLELKLKSGSGGVKVFSADGASVFDGLINTNITKIPLQITQPVTKLTVQAGCENKTITIYSLPNAAIKANPDPTQLALKPDLLSGITLDDINVETKYDLRSNLPPIASVELQIRKAEDEDIGNVETVIGTSAVTEDFVGIWIKGQEIDLQKKYKAAVVYNLNIAGFEPVVAAIEPLVLGALIIDYKRPIKITRDTTSTANLCQTGNNFLLKLAQKAEVEIKIKVFGQDFSLFKGILDKGSQSPLKAKMVPAKLPVGEYEFTITAVATDNPNLKESVTGLLKIDEPTSSVFPITHTFINGVDLADGHLTQTFTDFKFLGSGLSLEFTRVYSNANIVKNSPVGPGWTHNYFVRLLHSNDCGYYLFVGPDGQSQKFSEDFKPQKGYHTSLVKTADGFDFFTKGGVKYHFNKLIEIPSDDEDGLETLEAAPANLTSISDPSGNKVSLFYENNLLKSVSDNTDRRINIDYEKKAGAFRVSILSFGTTTGSINSRVFYSYDGINANLVKVVRSSQFEQNTSVSSNDRVLEYIYTGGKDEKVTHRLESFKEPNGNVTRYIYHSETDVFSGEGLTPSNCEFPNCDFVVAKNKANIIKAIEQPAVIQVNGAVNAKDLDSLNSSATEIITRFVYEQFKADQSHITKVIQPGNNLTTYNLNSDGSVTEIARQLENGQVARTAIVWDSRNLQRESETDPLGKITRFEYDNNGNVREMRIIATDPETGEKSTLVSKFTYERNFSRLTSKTEPFLEGKETPLTTSYDIDPKTGNVNFIISPLGQKTEYDYDVDGNLREVKDGRHKTAYAYVLPNKKFRFPSRVIQDTGNNTSFANTSLYDDRGRLRKQTNPYGVIFYRYDELDNLLELSTFSDPNADVTSVPDTKMTFEYYKNGELKSVTRLKEQVAGITVTTEIKLDALNRPTKVIAPDGSETLMLYDANSNQRIVRDARGVVRVTDYDSFNRPIKVAIQGEFGGPNNDDGTISRSTYDLVGNKLTETNLNNKTTTFIYDGFYRLKRKLLPEINPKDGKPYQELFTYNSKGLLLKSINGNGGESSFEYDELFRTTKIVDPAKRVTVFEYERNNQTSNPDRMRMEPSNRLDGSETNKLEISFEYDGLDRRTRQNVSFPNIPGGSPYRTQFFYNDSVHTVQIISPNNTTSTRKFDFSGNLIRDIVNNLSQDRSLINYFRYDGLGNQIAFVDANAKNENDPEHTTEFVYDSLSNLILSRDPLGSTRRFNFDPTGLLLSFTDANNITTDFKYDNLGRRTKTLLNQPISSSLTGLLDRMPSVLEFETVSYDDTNSSITVSDANGRKTSSIFDGLGRVTKVVDGVGLGDLQRQKLLSYDAINLLTATDWYQDESKASTTRFEYDVVNRLKTITESDNKSVKFFYDDDKGIIRSVDKLGIEQIKQGDPLGRLISVTLKGLNGSTIVTERNEYNEVSDLISTRDALGNTTRFDYDFAGRLAQINKAVGSPGLESSVKFNYDNLGNIISVENGNLSRSFTYDAIGRLKSSTPGKASFAPGQEPGVKNTTLFDYDAEDNVVKVTDPYKNITSYQYDELGFVIEVRHDFANNDENQNFVSEQYRYDPARNRRVDYRPDYTVVRNYDKLGRISNLEEYRGKFVSGSPFSTVRFDYYPDNNLKQFIDSRGQATDYEFDELKRLKRKSYPTAKDGGYGPVTNEYVYSYDDNDNLIKVDEKRLGATNLHYSFKYDEFSRLAEETDAFNKTNRFDYYDTGLRKTFTDPNNRKIAYFYDALNRLTDVKSDSYGEVSYDYFQDDLLAKVYNGGRENTQSSTEYTYDDNARVKKVVNRGRNNIISSYELNYLDDKNQIQLVESQQVNSRPSNETTLTSFGTSNRLVKIESVTDNTDERSTTEYTYDKSGNRTNEKITGGDNSSIFTGSSKIFQYVYDPQNRLRQIKDSDGREIANYEYNFLDQRVRKKTQNSDKYLTYDGSDLVAEWDEALRSTTSYMVGLQPTVRNEAGKSSYYLFNHLGSVSNVISQSGDLEANYRYDVWGKLKDPINTTNSKNRLTFLAQEFDEESGLYSIGQGTRYYSDKLGRFLQRDQLFGDIADPLTLNRYTYGLNNPVRFIDPTGFQAQGPGETSKLVEVTNVEVFFNEGQAVGSNKNGEIEAVYGFRSVSNSGTVNEAGAGDVIASIQNSIQTALEKGSPQDPTGLLEQQVRPKTPDELRGGGLFQPGTGVEELKDLIPGIGNTGDVFFEFLNATISDPSLSPIDRVASGVFTISIAPAAAVTEAIREVGNIPFNLTVAADNFNIAANETDSFAAGINVLLGVASLGGVAGGLLSVLGLKTSSGSATIGATAPEINSVNGSLANKRSLGSILSDETGSVGLNIRSNNPRVATTTSTTPTTTTITTNTSVPSSAVIPAVTPQPFSLRRGIPASFPNNRGLFFVEETLSANPTATRFQATIEGAQSNPATRRGIVPALAFDNPNTNFRAKDFVKFDGVETTTNTLIDRKLNITNNSKQLRDLRRQIEAIRQNPGSNLRFEVPNQKIANALIRKLTNAGLLIPEVSVRVVPIPTP